MFNNDYNKAHIPNSIFIKKENICNFINLIVPRESETDIVYGKKGIIIPLELIKKEYEKIKQHKNIVVVCPTGIKSNIAASFLKSKNIDSILLMGVIEALK